MRILEVEIEGFGSFYNKVKIPLEKALTVITGTNKDTPAADSNGAGKTTCIMDPVSWALYGVTPKGRKSKQVISHGEKTAKVRVVFDSLIVEREKSLKQSEKLTWWDKTEKVGGDLATTQTLLLQHLKNFNFSLFCNSTYFTRHSTTVQFTSATPSKRSEIFSQLVTTEPFLAAASRVKADLSDLLDLRSQHDNTLLVLQEQEKKIRLNISNTSQELREANDSTLLNADMNLLKLRRLEKERESLSNAVTELPTETLQELQMEKVSLEEELEKSKAAFYETKTQYENTKDLRIGEVCPTCLTKVSSEDNLIAITNGRESLKNLARNLKLEASNYKGLIAQVEEKQDILREHRVAEKVNAARIAEIDMEIHLLKDQMLPPDVTRLEGVLEEQHNQLEENIDYAQKTRNEIGTLIPQIADLKKLKTAFSSDVKNLILDNVRRGMEYHTNKYLKDLAGVGIRVFFPNQTETGKEKFEIKLEHRGHKQSISEFSGGETWRVSYAILLALRAVLDAKNSNPFDFVFFDDPAGDLDDTGIEEFVGLVSKLCSKGLIPQVIITLPRNIEVKDGKKLHVIKERGRSNIFT